LTTDQIKELVAMTLANFPHMQDKAMGPTITLWEEMLSDIPYPIAKASLFKILSTAKFWPNVAEIREAAISLTGNSAPLPADAWALVREAIRRDLPAERLHPAIQRTVRGMGGLDGIGYAEVPIGVLQTQFMRLYEPLAHDEQIQAQISDSVKALIASTQVKELPRAGGLKLIK